MLDMKRKSLNDAIAIIKTGGVGVMPTDTVYGIVALAANESAVARMYALKKREHKPGTVIAANVEQLVALGVPEKYLRKVEKLWPNPLSVEIALGDNLSYLHQETGRQAYRVVADERVRTLLEQTGPLVTSSANQPGESGSVDVSQAEAYFADEVDFYVDGGDLSGRAPSTIIKVSDGGIEVIRQGAVIIDEQLVRPVEPSNL
jgi:L-threonylcarbamoyladenylate synthase